MELRPGRGRLRRARHRRGRHRRACTWRSCSGWLRLSSALPAAGGGYTFARRALGPWGGFATGTAILIEYAIAPAAIATFIGAYVESLGLFGITDGWWVYLAAYAIFIGIHLSGVGEALKVMFVITAIALVGLVDLRVAAVGQFDASNLTDIAATDAAGASAFLPYGFLGIWAAIPFAIWFFLADRGRAAGGRGDGQPGAQRAARHHRRDGRAAGHLRGGAGPDHRRRRRAGDVGVRQPARRGARRRRAAKVVNYIGLAGLIASFFSIIYAYSRQLFALSRAGYLPTVLSVTNSRKAPTLALIVPGLIGFALSLTGQGALLLNMAVFGAALSYVLMMVSHIVLRRREPDMPRPYRTPGGIVTTGLRARHRGARGHRDLPGRPHRRAVLPGRVRRLHGLLRPVQQAPPGRQLPRRGVRGPGRRRGRAQMTYTQQVSGHTYQFDGLVELMAKATPLRSGDELAGCAAESDAERAAAAWVLADLPLTTFLHEQVVPYETDDVTRLIIDTHDRDAFAPRVAPDRRRVPGLAARHRTPSAAAPTAIAAVAPGLTPEMVAAVSKIMRNQDLIAVAAATTVTRGVPHHDRHAGNPGDPAAAQPSDRRSARHRRGHARRPADGLRRRGDRHQPGHRLAARHLGPAAPARRHPAALRHPDAVVRAQHTSPPRWS